MICKPLNDVLAAERLPAAPKANHAQNPMTHLKLFI